MTDTKTVYRLWFFFGWAGLHHLYLGRYIQAFVWFASCGGGCGLGWVRDYWRIPEYIKWSHPDKSNKKHFLYRAASKSKPECSKFREIGMTLMAYAMSTALTYLLPDFSELLDTDPDTYYLLYGTREALRVVGNVVGIYLIANIGELKCSLYYPVLHSLWAVPLLTHAVNAAVLGSSLSAHFVRSKGLEWRQLEPDRDKGNKKKVCFKVLAYLVACAVWVFIVAVGFYQHGSTTRPTGEKITVKEALRDFMSSPEMDQLRNASSILWNIGISGIWQEIWQSVDLTSKLQAYRTLGIWPWTDQETKNKVCRKLLAENHPDRVKGVDNKARAEEIFVTIHRACLRVSGSRDQKPR